MKGSSIGDILARPSGSTCPPSSPWGCCLWTCPLQGLTLAMSCSYLCLSLGLNSLLNIPQNCFFPLHIPLEKAMAPHSSTVAWKIPWMEEPGRLQSMGSLRVGHDWATSLSLSSFMHWRRKWQPTLVFLPRESQGRWSLVGCSAWGRTESDTTEATQQASKQTYPICFLYSCLPGPFFIATKLLQAKI